MWALVLIMFLIAPSPAYAGEGTDCPNRLSPGFRTYLPECRAYELVSPAYSESYQVNVGGISKGGTQLRAESIGSFSSPTGTSGLGQSYLVVRTENGWESSPMDVPFASYPQYRVQGMDSGFQNSIWSADAPGRFSQDLFLDSPSNGLIRIGPGAPTGILKGQLEFVGASDDLRHVIVLAHSPDPGEEDRLWPGDTSREGRRPSLYEYVGTGNLEPRLVGVSNKGSVEAAARAEDKLHINEAAKLISDCGTELGSLEGEAYNAVSTNGATVFFTADACGGSPEVNELYARIDGEKTVAISEPTHPLLQGSGNAPGECNAACEAAVPKPGAFAGASRDGSKVFFTTSQPLLNGDTDSGVDLYEAEIEEGIVTRLVQVSRGGTGDLTPGSGANVLGVARISEDGSRVYFVAEGALAGENVERRTPAVGKPNLYVVTRKCPGGEESCKGPAEHTSFVATLSPETDASDWSPNDVRPVQATPPGGQFLVFQSAADLTSDEEGREEAGQVLEYDAETGTLARVSHGEDGYNENGNTNIYSAVIPAQSYEGSEPEARYTQLALSEDGSRVFFSSYDALTPRALAGFNNVYEYRDGDVSLISDGQDVISLEKHPAIELIGTDESGRDVFFTSADRLVPQAGDTQVDVYDARSEGGFPAETENAPCLGDSCQPTASGPPSLVSPLTSSVAAETTAAAPVTPTLKTKTKTIPKIKKKKRKVKRRKTVKASEKRRMR